MCILSRYDNKPVTFFIVLTIYIYMYILTARECNTGNCTPKKTTVDRGKTSKPMLPSFAGNIYYVFKFITCNGKFHDSTDATDFYLMFISNIRINYFS